MAYEISVPPTPPAHLGWFRPDKNGVTDDDLVEVTLESSERLYFRHGALDVDCDSEGDYGSGWYLDPELLPDQMKSFLAGLGGWYLPRNVQKNARIGGFLELEHTRSQVGGNHQIEFSALSVITAMRPVNRQDCQRSEQIKGMIEVRHPNVVSSDARRIYTYV